ncbi:MAG: lipoyl domain-containing protein, partial [Anaerolineales bacterium]|nr:lipoyl domain-containing protein [Anaerolineales bacterium]MDW8445813.1 lipoyl domain-containing protein [Anaerolineales bacterium]
MTNSTEEAYPIVIPRLGLTMVEARIVEWYFKEGDWVNKGEPLFALENEKSVVDIESPASGYLHILAPTGVTFPVLTVIGELSPKPIAASPPSAAPAQGIAVVAEGEDGKRSE